MIKRIKGEEFDSRSLIATNIELKEFIEKFESEINRGISTLCILSIIYKSNAGGVHGYQILKEIDNLTKILVIEEGTLYPILRKLENDGIVKSRRKEVDGRLRKNYFLTKNGLKVYNRMVGFFSKLTEAIAPLFDVNVNLKSEKYLFCPMCANKIELTSVELRFCDVCGHNIEKELKERGLRNE